MVPQEHQVNKLKNTFISGYYMKDLSICDELIDYYEKSDNKTEGIVGGGRIDKTVKDSTEVIVNLWDNIPVLNKYEKTLQDMLEFYKLQYPEINETAYWTINTSSNIQKYNPGCGFKKIHFERSDVKSSTRFLVFMTYLNTVEDGGGTKWIHQDLELKAEKGLTVFWPVDWTHKHVGVISPTETKYIITGWYNFNNFNKE